MAFGGIVALILTSGILVWTWTLRRQVAERTRRLRESEARLQAILDHSSAAIYLKDLDGHYLLVNRALSRLNARATTELIGLTDWEILRPLDAQSFVANDRKVLDEGVPMTFKESAEYQGTVRTFVSVKFPIRDSNGVIQALGGVSTDISERKRSEQEVQAARETAERANHAKDRFLAILSHELRTPLTPVLVAVTEALST